MAHKEQLKFVEGVKLMFPDMFKDRHVLEIGSMNINGTVRIFFSNCFYHGIDVAQGKCVDEVSWAHEHNGGPYDTIISCETLEHDPFLNKTLTKIPTLLKPDGLLVITAAGPNRKEHGTLTNSPHLSGTCKTEYGNYYRNVQKQDLISGLKLSSEWTFEINYNNSLTDIYCWAVKNA